MLIVVGRSNFEKSITKLHEDVVGRVEGELKGIHSITDLSARVKELREQLEKAKIEKGRVDEERERKDREIEHKIGLERKRQEFELESGKKDAILKVREENLAADRKRFEEQMKFHDERFTAEVGYLKDMLSDIVKRLPSAEFTADLTRNTRRK